MQKMLRDRMVNRDPTLQEVNREIRKLLKQISETDSMIETLKLIDPALNYILELKVQLKNEQDLLLCLLKIKDKLID